MTTSSGGRDVHAKAEAIYTNTSTKGKQTRWYTGTLIVYWYILHVDGGI